MVSFVTWIKLQIIPILSTQMEETAKYLNYDRLLIINCNEDREIKTDNKIVKILPVWKAAHNKLM